MFQHSGYAVFTDGKRYSWNTLKLLWVGKKYGFNSASIKRHEIEKDAFKNCKTLMKIKIPEGITIIGRKAFLNCENLVSVELPKTLELVKNSFIGCSLLSSVHFPKDGNCSSFGAYTFYNCVSLKTVHLSPKTKYISSSMFDGCASLEEVYVYGNLKRICDYAFFGCTKLQLFCFQGTKEQFQDLHIDESNIMLKRAIKIKEVK